MPKGRPTAYSLSSRKVAAFSLDTSVIEAAGFRFEEGALRYLSVQLPPWMKLVMSDVVVQEIMLRRLANVEKIERQIRGGFDDLTRHVGSHVGIVYPTALNVLIDVVANLFEKQLEKYISFFDSTTVDMSAVGLSQRLFECYFEELPPFGGGRDKKHEFPDCMALLSLEDYALRAGIQVVVVSKDVGWQQFAEKSEYLYCLDSIQGLADLFEASSEYSKILRHKIGIFSRSNRNLQSEIKQAFAKRLPEMRWLFPSARNYRYIVAGTLRDVKVVSLEVPDNEVRLWITSSDRTDCVAEVVVFVDVVVDYEISLTDYRYAPDSVELISAASEQRIELKALLHINGELSTQSPDQWDIHVDVAEEKIPVLVEKFRKYIPDLEITSSGIDGMGDDMPF